MKLTERSKELPRREDSYPILKQVGWLGQSGKVYDRPPTSKQEPASYEPLYIKVGIWRREFRKKWHGLRKTTHWYAED